MGLLYWIGGATVPALIPWAYAVLSLIGIVVFALTRNYTWFAVSQFVPYMILPFLLMWSLGGPVDGSGVALWAGLAPIVALLLGHRRLGTLLAAVYASLIVASVVVPAPTGASPPQGLINLFFVLNLAGVPLVGYLLVRVFAGGQEGVLASVRSMVDRYLPTELVRVASADPRRLELGGEIAEVTVMFADLGGYSTYAEHRAPADVVALLNRYFAAALPAIADGRRHADAAPGRRGIRGLRCTDAATRPRRSCLPCRDGDPGADGAVRRCSAVGAAVQHRPQLRTGAGREHRQRRVPELHGHRRHDQRRRRGCRRSPEPARSSSDLRPLDCSTSPFRWWHSAPCR